jgi:hypothetical protein
MKKLLLLAFFFFCLFCNANSQSPLGECYQVSEMEVPRYAHSMTLINPTDGDLNLYYVIAGGYDDGGALATAEYNGGLYQMNEAHADHTAELLNDGRIIIIAGYNGLTNLTSIEAFDTETLEFTTVADLTVGRSFHRSVLLQDGRVLITGGFDGNVNLASCEIFNPVTNEIEEAASMNFARSSHTCNILNDGRVIVTGGFNPDNGFQQTSCEIYDPATNTWQNIAPLNSGRDNHAAATIDLNGQRLVISGGRYYNPQLNLFEGQSSLEIYDPQANIWTIAFPEFSQSLSYHQLHFVYGSIVFTPGGVGNSGVDVELTFGGKEGFDIYQEDAVISSLNPNTLLYSEIDNSPGYLYASIIKLNPFITPILYSGGLKSSGISNEIVECSYIFESVPEIELPPLKIYPIPAADFATVEWGTNADYVLNVFDLNGKLVATQKGRDSKALVSNLPSGNYIANVTIGENTISGNLSFR